MVAPPVASAGIYIKFSILATKMDRYRLIESVVGANLILRASHLAFRVRAEGHPVVPHRILFLPRPPR